MADSDDIIKWSFAIPLGCILLLVVILLLKVFQPENQIARPENVTPAPVVHELPDLASLLETTKARCEGAASSAIEIIRRERRDARTTNEGRRLYTEVAAEVNGCVQYVHVALERKFLDRDESAIGEKLAAVKTNMDRFISWEENLETRITGALIDPWKEVLSSLRDMMIDANKQDEIGRARLGEMLERCRMRTWDEIHQSLVPDRPAAEESMPPSRVPVRSRVRVR